MVLGIKITPGPLFRNNFRADGDKAMRFSDYLKIIWLQDVSTDLLGRIENPIWRPENRKYFAFQSMLCVYHIT
jgi:hypothetical protein